MFPNYFQNETCMTRRSLCFSTFFAAVSPPWSFLYSTPWTAISNFILLSFILFSWHCLDFNDLKVILFLYSSVHIVVHVHLNIFVITLRNLLRSLVGIRINSSWQKDKDYVETFIEFFLQTHIKLSWLWGSIEIWPLIVHIHLWQVLWLRFALLFCTCFIPSDSNGILAYSSQLPLKKGYFAPSREKLSS